MADYQRIAQRFFFNGISALPADAIPQGKLPYAKNIRSYEDGVIQPRDGLTARSVALGAGIHSLYRLNDATAFNGGVSAVRVAGAGNSLYTGLPGGTSYAALASGLSGNPLTFLEAQPPQSPRPYLYVADSAAQFKFTTDGAAVPIGIPQPAAFSTAPLTSVQALAKNVQAGLPYSAAGDAAGATSNTLRVNTTISQILYDGGGVTPGYASIVAADFTNMTVGMVLVLGGFETNIVTDLTIPVADTTVESIIYDAGATGLCTIQPAGSLGTGQAEAPSLAAYARRAGEWAGQRLTSADGAAGTPLTPDSANGAPSRKIRQTDFPVNCLVTLAGGETVRILSVAVGPDGTQSFRCVTSGTITAGAAITGVASVRMYVSGAYAGGEALTDPSTSNELTYPILPDGTASGTPTTLTAGVQMITPLNFGQFTNGIAVLPEDDIHIGVQINRLTEVVSIRLYLDVDGEVTDFLENYFFYEWRASDIISAIQGTNAATVTPIVQARQTVVTNQQLDPNDAARTARQRGGGFARAARQKEINAKLAADAASARINNPSASTSDDATSTQLALGNNQWIDLRAKIGDLVRVGTDLTRSLVNVQGVQILVFAQATGVIGDEPIENPPLAVSYGDLWIAGGSGPDVGDVGDPYVYRYRYRSSGTGVVGNPSPQTLGGVITRRQSVALTPTPSTDPEVDKIDWFRLGGALTAWTYVGSGSNSATPYIDNYPDSAIDGGEVLAFDNFQPWPTQDLPRSGTVDIAGTAVRRVSGDAFDTSWAPGSPMIINGRVATLYASPVSASLLYVNENLLSGSGVAFSMLGATKLNQNLRSFWGDANGLYFACGDPNNPGTLYFSHGNNPESARDTSTVQVSAASEPLQGGGVYNTFAFVASTEQMYTLLQSQNADGTRGVRAIRTPCGRGFWTPWSFCIGPEGIFFLGPNGIFLTQGGSPAEPLTDADLRAIFPNDGTPGSSVNGIPAPDMSATTRLRLSYVAGVVYFDYRATDGQDYTLFYDISIKRWFLDDSALTAVWTRIEEPGDDVFDQILGGGNGVLYQYDDDAFSDAGTAIAYALWTPLVDGGQPRVTKQVGDIMLSVDPADANGGITVEPYGNDGNATFPAAVYGTDVNGRVPLVINLNAGAGAVLRNVGLKISGSVTAADTGRPEFFLWEPSLILKADDTTQRASDWDDLGYQGDKFIQGVVLNANTYGVNKQIVVEKDGAVQAIALTINHAGEEMKPYPQAAQSAPGWTPFVTHLVRIRGGDDVDWQMLGYRFVFEPVPELATQWETQYTSHDLEGYFSVRDGVIAHESTCPIRWRIIYDDGSTTDYTIPASGGVYKRTYVVCVAGKGIAVKYQLRSSKPCRIYKRDCSVRVWGWGSNGGYQQTTPFGGPHRQSGADI